MRTRQALLFPWTISVFGDHLACHLDGMRSAGFALVTELDLKTGWIMTSISYFDTYIVINMVYISCAICRIVDPLECTKECLILILGKTERNKSGSTEPEPDQHDIRPDISTMIPSK